MNEQEIREFLQGAGYTENWLTPSKLKRGHVYLAKDGRVMLYLGISSQGIHVFYVMASCYIQYFYDDEWNAHIRIMNQEWQIKAVSQTIEESMTHKGDRDCVMSRKGIPNIFGEFPCKAYEDVYRAWYQDSFGDAVGSAKVPDINAKTVSSAYVSVKDLRPGDIYYTGNGWSTIFVYMGRSSGNKFIWYNIRSIDVYLKADVHDMLWGSRYTDNNKRVKPLYKLIDDPDGYGVETAKEIMEKRPHVDMLGVDQHMLDEAAGEV